MRTLERIMESTKNTLHKIDKMYLGTFVWLAKKKFHFLFCHLPPKYQVYRLFIRRQVIKMARIAHKERFWGYIMLFFFVLPFDSITLPVVLLIRWCVKWSGKRVREIARRDRTA